MNHCIKSPLNYTGNKYGVLSQFEKIFPAHINRAVDLFCGGGTVGLNIFADEVIFIDRDERVINLLDRLAKADFYDTLHTVEGIISEYGLSNSYRKGYAFYRTKCADPTGRNGLKDFNKAGYLELRRDYNALPDKTSEYASAVLYVLSLYGFDCDIRFNSKGDFNIPPGKTDLSPRVVEKLKAFSERVKEKKVRFLAADFDSPEVAEIADTADFIYMDPPYLICEAVYNCGWTETEEERLLRFVSGLLTRGKAFALSNVTEKEGRVNAPLSRWCEEHKNEIKIVDMEKNYKNPNWHKKNRDAKEREVVICGHL